MNLRSSDRFLKELGRILRPCNPESARFGQSGMVFANDLLRTGALEGELAAVTAERDGLRNILEKDQMQIRELTVKLNQAKAALTEAQRRLRDPKWLG